MGRDYADTAMSIYYDPTTGEERYEDNDSLVDPKRPLCCGAEDSRGRPSCEGEDIQSFRFQSEEKPGIWFAAQWCNDCHSEAVHSGLTIVYGAEMQKRFGRIYQPGAEIVFTDLETGFFNVGDTGVVIQESADDPDSYIIRHQSGRKVTAGFDQIQREDEGAYRTESQ